MREITAELVAHLGGPERVTAPQRFLIDRCAVDLLRLELLDREMFSSGLSEHDSRIAHALRNSVRLALRELGLRPPAPPKLSADEALRRIRERASAAA